MVGVLVFVDKHVLKAATIKLHHLRVLIKDAHYFPDEVIEVHRVRRAQAALIFLVHARHGELERILRPLCLRARLLRGDELVLAVGNLISQNTRRILLQIQLHVLRNHGEQPAGIIAVINGEIRVQARHQLGVIAQDANTNGVKSGHPHPLRYGADKLADALLHLRGCLVGKGNGEDLPRCHPALPHEVRNAAGQHGSLARARAGHNKQRRARMRHGLFLLRI